MKVYEQRASVTTSSGSYNQATLENVGGLLRYLLVRSNTATTNFQVTLTDYKGILRKRYGFHTGELIDDLLTMPVSGPYTIGIVNGSPDDTFTIVFGVQES
jgi:hypothetical protein